MLTQPSRRGIDNNTPSCFVDIQDRPYIIRTIGNELFEVIFLNKNDFYKNMDPIIEQAKKTVSDCLLEEKFRHNIFIELFENIYKHADGSSSSKFSLKKESSQYTIELSNFCELDDFNKLLSFLKINEMSSEDMKEAYKKQMLQGKYSERGGAGLGFRTVARAIKKHHKSEDIKLIDIQNIGKVEKTKINNEGEIKPIELINAKITINIPFLKQNDKKDNLDDHHNNEDVSL